MEFKDYYRILGIQPGSGISEIKDAFRKMASKSHPDKHPYKCPDTSPFHEIKEAYDVLSNPERREEYDRIYRRHKTKRTEEPPVYERSAGNHSLQEDHERFFREMFNRFFNSYPLSRSGRDRDNGFNHIHYDDML